MPGSLIHSTLGEKVEIINRSWIPQLVTKLVKRGKNQLPISTKDSHSRPLALSVLEIIFLCLPISPSLWSLFRSFLFCLVAPRRKKTTGMLPVWDQLFLKDTTWVQTKFHEYPFGNCAMSAMGLVLLLFVYLAFTLCLSVSLSLSRTLSLSLFLSLSLSLSLSRTLSLLLASMPAEVGSSPIYYLVISADWWHSPYLTSSTRSVSRVKWWNPVPAVKQDQVRSRWPRSCMPAAWIPRQWTWWGLCVICYALSCEHHQGDCGSEWKSGS